MIWQDAAFTVGALVFSISLILTIRSSQKPPISTCVSTAAVLWVYVVAFATLEFAYSAVTTGLTALAWSIILIQQIAERAYDS